MDAATQVHDVEFEGTVYTDIPVTMTQQQFESAVRAMEAASMSREQQVVSAPRTMGEEAMRQGGLMARSLPGGLADLTGIVAEPLNVTLDAGISGINYLTGLDIPKFGSFNQAAEQGLDQFFPTPETGYERLAQAGMRATTGAGAVGAGAKLLRAAPGVIAEAVGAPRLQAGVNSLSRWPKLQKAAQGVVDSNRVRGAIPQLGPPSSAVPAIIENLAEAPLLQGVAGTTATAASDLASTLTDNPLMIAGAGILGGGGSVPVANTGSRMVGRGIDDIVRSVSRGKQEVIAGEILNRFANTPARTQSVLAEGAEEFIPGSRPTTPQASGDPGLLGVENAMAQALDNTNVMAQRRSANNAARQEFLDRELFGVPTKGRRTPDEQILHAQAKLDRTYTEYAEPAFRAAKPVPMGRDWINNNILRVTLDVLESPAGAKTHVKAAMNFARKQFSDDPNIDLTDPRTLYAIRQNLEEAANGKLDVEGQPRMSQARGELYKVIHQLDDVIETAAPGYKKYLDIYKKRAIPLRQMQEARNLREMTMDRNLDPLTGLPVTNMSFVSRMRTLRRKQRDTKSTSTKNPKISDQQWDVMERVAADLDRETSASSRVIRTMGSETAKNMTVASIMGHILGEGLGDAVMDTTYGKQIQSSLGWVGHFQDQQVRQLLMEAVLDPELAAMLMKKASMINIEHVGKQLERNFRVSVAASGLYGDQ